MKSFFCFERPCIAWQNCVRFFCAFIMFWANNAWLEQRTRSHAHVLYFSILTLKPCITGNLFPLCLFSKNPTPKRCDYIYHILWKKIISSNICWTFYILLLVVFLYILYLWVHCICDYYFDNAYEIYQVMYLGCKVLCYCGPLLQSTTYISLG